MRIQMSLQSFTSALSTVTASLAGKSQGGNDLLLTVSEDGLTFAGYSPTLFCRVVVETEEIEIEEAQNFTIKLDVINKIMSSFQSLYKTRVEKVELVDVGVKLRLNVYEEPLDVEDVKYNQVSQFVLDKLGVRSSVLAELTQDFPAESSPLQGADLDFYISTLQGGLGGGDSDLNSKIQFAADYVFVMGSAYASFIENKLDATFHNLVLSAAPASFLRKLAASTDTVECARTDKYLVVRANNVEAFIRTQTIKVEYSSKLAKRSKDLGYELDRRYLRDVLRRLDISQTSVEVEYDGEDQSLHVTNGSLDQHIPLTNIKGDLTDLKFKFPVSTLLKAIIGDDAVFSERLFMHFADNGTGWGVFVSDATGHWVSVVQLTKVSANKKSKTEADVVTDESILEEVA